MKYEGQSTEAVEAKTRALAEADRRKKQVMDETMLRYLEAARFADIDELAEVTDAVDRLHHAHEEEIRAKHAAEEEEFRRRFAWERQRPPLTPLNDPNAPLPVCRIGQLARPKRSN